jgi:hypothetical protein
MKETSITAPKHRRGKFRRGAPLLLGAMFFASAVLGCPETETPPETILGTGDKGEKKESVEPAGVIARWDFKDNDESRTGSLTAKNLVIRDKTDKGNDLTLQFYNNADAPGKTIENLAFSGASMTGSGGSMHFKGTTSGPDITQTVGAEFVTVDDAPINAETFEQGYTFEFLYQLPLEFTNADRWMGLMRRELPYGNYTAQLDDYEAECGGLSVAVSNCKEVQFFTVNKDFTYGTPSVWGLSMDNGGEWYHIAVVNDNEEIKMYVNGAIGFRNHKPDTGKDIVGIYAHEGNARFIIGSSIWNEFISPIDQIPREQILDKFLHGYLETVRVTARALKQDEWLITDFGPYAAKMGSNDPWKLQGPDNGSDSYVFGIIPDTQNTVRYCSPEAAENGQSAWTGTGVLDNASTYLKTNKAAMKIAGIIHLGDVVDQSNIEWQYQSYNRPLMDMVNNGIKVQMSHGNHDQTGANGLYAKYFRNSFSDYAKAVSTDTGVGPADGSGYITFEADTSALLDSYMTVTAGSYEYLFINMQYSGNAYSSAHQNWLTGVLDANPDIPTVIFCHNLFNVSDTEPEKISLNNAGNSVWNIARTHNQVFLMIAGHNHGSGWITQTNNSGNDVFMMLVDYQFGYNGGNAYMRFLEFNETAKKIYISTFSPAAAYLTGTAKTIYDINYMTGLGNVGSWDIDFAGRFSFYAGE